MSVCARSFKLGDAEWTVFRETGVRFGVSTDGFLPPAGPGGLVFTGPNVVKTELLSRSAPPSRSRC